jgi:cysteine desulfurase
MKKIYLDYAATTPVDKRVLKEMLPFLEFSAQGGPASGWGNTMSLHFFGQEAKLALENSRAILASIINAEPNEIIFTSSATESNNLALKGVSFAAAGLGNQFFSRFNPSADGAHSPQKKLLPRPYHIIISSIEHPCIAESAKWLEKQGFEITKLPVDKFGMINPEDVKKAIKENTILVSVIHASNEIGTIQPIKEIGEMIKKINPKILFHTDAAQSFGKIAIDVKKDDIDLLTASSHKIYGPKGAGLLYVRKGINLVPILHGGGQENGLRGSTINVPAIVGFAKAAEICQKEMKSEAKRQTALRNYLIKNILKIKNSYLNGHPTERLANNANFRFDFVEGESLVMQLDMEGIACSTGSACSSFKLEPSHVLLATGLRPEQAHGSLRVSLGRFTTKNDINKLIKVLPEIVKKIRAISPYGKK